MSEKRSGISCGEDSEPRGNAVSQGCILHRFGLLRVLRVLSSGNAQCVTAAKPLTSVIRLLKTRHLTTRMPVYTVVKPRTCRRAIIVTIRDRIVTG